MMLGLLILGLNAAFGIRPLDIGLPTFLMYYIPAVVLCELMALWLQRYNVQPTTERGLLLAGRLASLAAWPIFFAAFLEVLTGKRLRYKVTPKGAAKNAELNEGLKTFSLHLSIAGYSVICFFLAIADKHASAAVLFWLAVSAILMLYVPFAAKIKETSAPPSEPEGPAFSATHGGESTTK